MINTTKKMTVKQYCIMRSIGPRYVHHILANKTRKQYTKLLPGIVSATKIGTLWVLKVSTSFIDAFDHENHNEQ